MSQQLLPPDPVDDVLGDFFKSQMPKPWPAAPRTAEPSGLAKRPVANNRARYTLAASVAIMLGACWYFSGASHPAERGKTQPAAHPGVLEDGSAKMPDEFKKPKTPMLD
jgi:hypothetical protein